MAHSAATVEGRATSVDLLAKERSLHSPSPPIGSIDGFCKSCGNYVGEFFNSWHKVAGSYYVPALLASYRSLLKQSGSQKAAPNGTDLKGCSIVPSSCPSASCTEPPIGFTVVAAPASRREFLGREFFKLSRIELRYELIPGENVVVEPSEEKVADLWSLKGSDLSSPVVSSPTSSEDAMEVDSRPSPASNSEMFLIDYHEKHQTLQHTGVKRPSMPTSNTIQLPTGPVQIQSVEHKAVEHSSPSVLSSKDLDHHISQHVPQPQSSQVVADSFDQRTSSLNANHIRSPGLQNTNGSLYPRLPGEVSFDAIERLQTQTSQNSGALAAHTRDIRQGEESLRQLDIGLRREFAAQVHQQGAEIQRVDEAVARLQLDMHGVRQAVESLGRELAVIRAERQREASMPQTQLVGGQDTALELMAQQVAIVSHKANEIDMIKITIEILKNKLQRLEDGAAISRPNAQQSHSPCERSIPSAPCNPPPRVPPVALSHESTPSQQPPRLQTHYSFDISSSTTTPEVVLGNEPSNTQSSGWAAINAGAKRSHPNFIDALSDPPGSPKRQKKANVDTEGIYPTPQSHLRANRSESIHNNNADPIVNNTPPAVPSRPPASRHSPAILNKQTEDAPYNQQDGSINNNWRFESQRLVEHRPRGRPRGSGSGSRGGRSRKSLPVHVHELDTVDWEGADRQGIPESQISPVGHSNHVARADRGIARRGSGGGGGGGRGDYNPNDRSVSLGLQGVSLSMNMGLNESYSQTKKTRSKPVRNADGVLIRKDGRPDMRSQSSAANLRKVHARKEEQHAEHSPPGSTSTLHTTTNTDIPDISSPSVHISRHRHVTASVRDKHNVIMGKMFPDGVDKSRKEHDYAHQIFLDDRNHPISLYNQQSDIIQSKD